MEEFALDLSCILIDCEPGTPKEQMSIEKIVQEMIQQEFESVPQHLTSKWRIPKYISKKRVQAYIEKCKEIGAIPSKTHPNDVYSTLPYAISIARKCGEDKC